MKGNRCAALALAGIVALGLSLSWLLLRDRAAPDGTPRGPGDRSATSGPERAGEAASPDDAGSGSEPLDSFLGLVIFREIDGAPVASTAVDVTPAGGETITVWTDAAGRARIERTDPPGPLRVRAVGYEPVELPVPPVARELPHRVRFEEFGFLGPLDEAAAVEGEHLLELRPAVTVPAVLRNVVRGASYCAYVSLVHGDVEIGTTINGQPIAIEADGVARTSLRLPASRRVRVSIGYRGESFFRPRCSEPVEFEAGRTSGPLEFELETLFARITGAVVGVPADELPRLSVSWCLASDRAPRIPVAADGSFSLPHAPRGRGVRALARRELTLARDLDGIRLSPEN